MPGIPKPVVRLAKGTEGPKCYGSLANAAEMIGLPYGSRRTLKKAITDSTECKGFFWRYASPEEAAEAAAAVLPAPPPPPMPPPLPPPHGGRRNIRYSRVPLRSSRFRYVEIWIFC